VHRLDRLSIDDLIECSSAFRGISSGAASLEEAAQEITRYLHHHLVDGEGAPACPLVRLYKTHRFDGLGPELQAFARSAAEEDVEADTRCLTLLGTSGDLAEWNDRRRSLAHRAIPLVSVEVVEQSPMIASLIRGMGLDVADVVAPDARAGIALHHRDYDLFFVPEAEGSPLVPAQRDFVVPWGIRSVVGCGGMLPSSDLFALIVFSRLPLSEETADLFRTLALSVKATIVPYTFNVFADD
jgi:hypothetical protein